MSADNSSNTKGVRRLKAALAYYIPTRAQVQAMVENASKSTTFEVKKHLASVLETQLTEVRGAIVNLQTSLERVEDRSRTDVTELRGYLQHVDRLARAQIDELGVTKWQLADVRATHEYEAAFNEREPLVTVRIATFNRPGPLIERTVPSVLGQTYERLEVIVVGDGCTDDTGDQLAKVGDDRVRFVNLPYRFPYPDDRHSRRLVAGSPAMNVGAQLARGSWIAPLDDDDEFVSEHVEKLLKTSLSRRFEMTYGKYPPKGARPGRRHDPRFAPPTL